MNKPHLFIFLLFLGLIGGSSWYLTADKQADLDIQDPTLGSSHLRFIQNIGQWESVVQYKVPLFGGDIYFEENRLTYHFYDVPDERGHGQKRPKAFGMRNNEEVRHHAFHMEFVGANPEPELQAQLRYPEYHNYFLGDDSSKWAGGVPLFGMLTYKNLYPGIHLRVYGLGDDVKYDFLVDPGADPSQIQIHYDGLDQLKLKDGHLRLISSLREITELPPVSYQEIDGKKVAVASRYQLENEEVSYQLPKGYDDRYPLVIDPTLVFSTYTGSVSNNWGFTATFDEDGNAYAGGIQRGNTVGTGYPTTTGAFQTAFAGGTSDVAISKFSSDGSTLVYATYLGGPPAGNPFTSYEDQPHSMIVTEDGELVVFGRTNSPNFPRTTGAYQTSIGGGYDIFVTKFTADGTGLMGSTYVGGSSADGVNGSADFSITTDTKYNYGDDARGEVILDNAGNILVAASTNSSNFPTPGSPAQGSLGGGQDGCVFKLSSDLTTLMWSTYFGSAGEDAAYTVKLDQTGNVFIAGGSNSQNLPGSNGLNGSFLGGEADGFVAKLNNNGSSILQATYLGTNDYDQVYLLDIDRENNIYVVGQTEGAYPVISAPGSTIYSNTGAKQFITKLNNNLNTILYSTIFGSTNATKPNISPTALLVDRCDNVYVTGWGGSTNQFGTTNGMPTFEPLSGGSTTDGSDFYTIVLSRDAHDLIFASYLGGNNTNGQAGDHVDGGTSRFDKNGIVYHAVCAGCWGVSTFPSTPGAYSQTNNATGPGSADPGCNLLVFKLAFDLAGVEADFTPLDEEDEPIILEAGCAPYEVSFDNQSLEGANPGVVTYLWDFGDNGATSTDFEPVHTYSSPGTYDVTLIITDSSSCNIADTAFRQVLIFPPPPVNIGPDVIACLDDTISLTTQTTGAVYEWGPIGNIVGPNDVPNPQVYVSGPMFFYLNLTDANGCVGLDSIFVSIDTTFRVIARADTVICEGGSVPLRGSNTGNAISYEWTSTPTAAIANPTAANTTVSNLDTTTTFFLTAEDEFGCKAVDSFIAEVFEVFTLEDTFVCLGNNLLLASSNGVSFSWAPDDGSLDNVNIASPTATPSVTTTYTVTAISSDGCISVKDVTVEVKPLPEAEVSKDTEICEGEELPLTASGGETFLWTPATGLSDPTIANPIASPASTTTYLVTVADEFGCQDQAALTIVVNPLPDVQASPGVTICEGESVPLSVTGASFYEWSPASSLVDPGSSNPIASPTETTTYLVQGIDAFGCQSSDSVVVTVVPRPITSIEGVNLTCEGGQIELTASGGDSYLWNTGQTTPTISVLPLTPTLFIATTFVGGCEGLPDSVLVDQFFAFPEANFSFEPQTGFSPLTVQFTNLSEESDSYLWDFGFGATSEEENPVHVYPAAGTYEIRLIAFTNQNCADTIVQTIRVDNVTLHAPTAFSPNGDGSNDEFYVGYVGIRSLTVKIFSRWGHQVYESDNPDFRWNGVYKNDQVPEGVYVYVIQGVGENDRQYERVGTVTVIR